MDIPEIPFVHEHVDEAPEDSRHPCRWFPSCDVSPGEAAERIIEHLAEQGYLRSTGTLRSVAALDLGGVA